MAQTCFRLWSNMFEDLTVGRAKARIRIKTDFSKYRSLLVMREGLGQP